MATYEERKHFIDDMIISQQAISKAMTDIRIQEEKAYYKELRKAFWTGFIIAELLIADIILIMMYIIKTIL